VSSVLHAVNKLSFAGFVAFCECLVETQQTAIIVDFLTPELNAQRQRRQQQQQQQPMLNVDVSHHAGEDEASSLMFDVVDWRTAEQCEVVEPTPDPTAAVVVNYDWKTVIRENFMQLTQHIDPDSGLLNHLLSSGVISHVSADVIRVRSICRSTLESLDSVNSRQGATRRQAVTVIADRTASQQTIY